MEVICNFTLKAVERFVKKRSREVEIYDEVHTNSNGQPCGLDKSYINYNISQQVDSYTQSQSFIII